MKNLKKYQYLLIPFSPLLVIAISIYLTRNHNYILFNPQGFIAQQESWIIVSFILFVFVCIALPIFLLTFFVAWKYRENNTKAVYKPNWTFHQKFQFLWWIIPTLLILCMGALMWQKTHLLDPTKQLSSANKPLTIQVVSLRWKWLFLYPEQHIATVNVVAFPEKTPVVFELTADSPMNSFWIPNISGQMYSMTGMVNKLHVMSNTQGEYPGSAAELNGEGFAGMKFVAKSVSQADFDTWVQSVQKSSKHLDSKAYDSLAKPSENTPQMFYASYDPTLYNTIIMKYMMPN